MFKILKFQTQKDFERFWKKAIKLMKRYDSVCIIQKYYKNYYV